MNIFIKQNKSNTYCHIVYTNQHPCNNHHRSLSMKVVSCSVDYMMSMYSNLSITNIMKNIICMIKTTRHHNILIHNYSHYSYYMFNCKRYINCVLNYIPSYKWNKIKCHIVNNSSHSNQLK